MERHPPYGITQVKVPCLNPSQIGRDSICLPRRDGRLNWPRWLVKYQDGLPARRQSVWARYSEDPLFRKSIVQICATVLGFDLGLGLALELGLWAVRVSGNSGLSK